MGKILELYIDESGDFGGKERSSELFVISIAAQITKTNINTEQATLISKLSRVGHTGMIHTAPLVRGKGDDYTTLSKGQRQAIFWALFHFKESAQIFTQSYIIDRTKYKATTSLANEAETCLMNFYNQNQALFTQFDNINIYYDNGQPRLTEVICKVFTAEQKFTVVPNFDHNANYIFQVADLCTFTDKLTYKLANKLPLTSSEQRFFTDVDLKRIKDQATHYRFA